MKNPVTELEWLETAEEVVENAREAARSGSKSEMRAAADACAEFISKRTLACPKEAVETVAAVQAELSQLIVKEDIGSIKSRTAQFEAFLQDIVRLSEKAERAADLISFKSAKLIVDDVTGIVSELKQLQTQFANDQVENADSALKGIIDRLRKLQEDFAGLQPGS